MTPNGSNPPPLVGIDIGGTRIKAGLADASLLPRARASTTTPADHDPQRVADAITSLVRSVLQQAQYSEQDLRGVGIGVPGRVDPASGVVLAAANLQGWRDIPLGQLVRDALGVPAAVHNDANAAAFGEFTLARRQNPALQSAALLTLGTGVGGGIVLSGQLITGANQFAGEIGHVIVEPDGLPCPCGQRGCLERYAAAPALVRTMRQQTALVAAAASPSTGDAGELSPPEIFALAERGDATAQHVVANAANYLAIACINLTRLLDLDTIFIGGGLGDAGETLLARIREAYAHLNWHLPQTPPRILPALLGNDAGWLGAAALAANPR